jgi:hypothetical protein
MILLLPVVVVCTVSGAKSKKTNNNLGQASDCVCANKKQMTVCIFMVMRADRHLYSQLLLYGGIFVEYQ